MTLLPLAPLVVEGSHSMLTHTWPLAFLASRVCCPWILGLAGFVEHGHLLFGFRLRSRLCGWLGEWRCLVVLPAGRGCRTLVESLFEHFLHHLLQFGFWVGRHVPTWLEVIPAGLLEFRNHSETLIESKSSTHSASHPNAAKKTVPVAIGDDVQL